MNKYEEEYNDVVEFLSNKKGKIILPLYKVLVERATPKKPISHYKEGLYNYDNCPNCGDYEIDNVEMFCPKCGQALDWSE